jgi:class 3 adenylate cyclase
MPSFTYRWEWRLKPSPTAFWPYIADTNRFNLDRGNAPYDMQHAGPRQRNGAQHLKMPSPLGVMAWDEEPYEWVYPYRYGVNRRFASGIFDELLLLAELNPTPDGGTRLIFTLTATTRGAVGRWLTPLVMARVTYAQFDKAIRQYEREALRQAPPQIFTNARHAQFAPGGRERLALLQKNLATQIADPTLAPSLVELIENADDLALFRLRPYALADYWEKPRRAVLELCLHATRVGLLNFRWDVICPLCRGPKQTAGSLSEVQTRVHCDACLVDFDVNFDRAVELTFRPNPAIRLTPDSTYCVGGPELTPHIVAQQALQPHENRAIQLGGLEAGRYRLRALDMRGGQALAAVANGSSETALRLTPEGWPTTEPTIGLQPTLHFENATNTEQLFILERLAWSDQAATAAEVTALQVFRDLFANEALRPGENFSVGRVTILFTDLRGSTRLYRERGDAVAFGRVMSHFDILKTTIAAHDGALIKTIGDAVMAVFLRPTPALQAVLTAQAALATAADLQDLRLKAGIHSGPCVAVTLNDRLDYFGSTVNLAARLEGLSAQKNGVVVSAAVYDDPEVQAWLAAQPTHRTEPFESSLKGFEGEVFQLWVVK